MESAVELAMETSRVDLVVCRYSRRRRSVDGAGTKKFSRKLQLKIQQIRRRAKYGMSCDDISLDQKLSADEAKRERGSDVVLRSADEEKREDEATSYEEASSRKLLFISRELLFISRCYLEIARAKRCRLHKLIRQRFAIALKIQQENFALIFNQSQGISRPDLFKYRTGFSLDELSGCASLGQMPSFYYHCAVRSLGARLCDKHMGRDRRMKNLSCSLYWSFIILSNSVARVI
ncbi:hypothetical protein F511_03777 [Dorcoceras hygrometricum]|uniref:Uncharacterized protein n=1 Tax=Dorcoceras hygrometricum TaxID=472368 RepID=A0A2Z7B3N6_9LAMI|nr:hypothetical protein F511_03777 [Dorcoceras hygrometricum]